MLETPVTLILVALAAVLLGIVLARLLLVPRAHARGREAREPELVALARDLQSTQAQRNDLAARLEAADQTIHTLRQRADALADERAGLAAQAERVTGLERQLAALTEELRISREQRSQAKSLAADLAARLEEQKSATDARLREFDVRLKAEIGNLATTLLEEKSRAFGERSEKQLGGLLAPLREQLQQFSQTIANTNVEIHSLKQLNRQITAEAANLTRALKGDSRTQGAWGELVLERVLEMSGLQQGRGYELQMVFQDEEGGRPRPDVVVRLPDAKDLVIDAKVSLIAWDRACAAPDDAERAMAMKAHVESLKRHIDGLGKRDYTRVEGLRTVDFVLMFVPVEAAWIEALRIDDGLYAHALKSNIALVSPSTLLATLRTVAHLWKLEDRNVNAQEIARQAGALHDSFVLLESELDAVGEQLARAARSHENAVKRISTGKGNLLGRVDKLRTLGASARKQLSDRRLESEDEGPPAADPVADGSPPDPAQGN
ncbi:DNA recombination protein RmuC [Chiayiivirga flava]|uniref:DNA recombination protein RmuC n=1 Tax=Chiayiivirga flava TaxID=659595 RepID=A0A7W8G0B8_9GAMM|nr:DNA recombination protein RmuC [Chiayiivirga flava]MBB5206600.1 DNA recombination protein RmuC [Chiayiivirga flava]